MNRAFKYDMVNFSHLQKEAPPSPLNTFFSEIKHHQCSMRAALHVASSRRGLCSNDDVIFFAAKKMTSLLLRKSSPRRHHVARLSKRGAVPTWNSKSYEVMLLIISAHKAEERKFSACCVQLPSCHFLELCIVEVTLKGGS